MLADELALLSLREVNQNLSVSLEPADGNICDLLESRGNWPVEMERCDWTQVFD